MLLAYVVGLLQTDRTEFIYIYSSIIHLEHCSDNPMLKTALSVHHCVVGGQMGKEMEQTRKGQG